MQETIKAGDAVTAVQVRFDPSLFLALESWRRQQPVIPSRPAAIRALLQQSLDTDSAASREWGKP